jgi:hypothetical protein
LARQTRHGSKHSLTSAEAPVACCEHMH